MINITAIDTTDDLTDALPEQDLEKFKKRSISGATSYMLRSLFLYSVGLVTAVVLGNYLSPAEFGTYGIVTQIIALLQFVATIGLGPALIQKKVDPSLKEYRVVFTTQQFLSWLLFISVVLIIQIPSVALKIGSEGIWVILALAISFPLDSLRIISAIKLERKLDFSKLVIPTIIEQLIYNAVLLICVMVFDLGVLSYAYAVIIRGVVGTIAMFMVQPWSIGFAFDKKILRQILATGAKFQLSDFLARIKDQLFYLLLGAFLTKTEFGYITWAKSWSQLPYMLTVQNVIAITFPAYSRLQHDKKLLKRAIEKTTFFISISIFPLLVGMSVFIVPFTSLISNYEKWQPALLTFILFTLSIGWAAVSTPLTNTLNAIGKINQTLQLMLMWTTLTWILTPGLVWFFGFNGVAIAAAIISISSVMPVIYVKRVVDVDIWSQVSGALLSAGIMALVGVGGMSVWMGSAMNMVLGMILTSLVYLICVYILIGKKLSLEIQSLRMKA